MKKSSGREPRINLVMGINNSAQGVENRENISRHDIAHTRVRTISKTDTARLIEKKSVTTKER